MIDSRETVPRGRQIQARACRWLGLALVAGGFLAFGRATVIMAVAGVWLYNRGRRMVAAVVTEAEVLKIQDPVLYLRPFGLDVALGRTAVRRSLIYGLGLSTEEEQLVEVLGPVGPCVAIGRPGERLPALGAVRLYVPQDRWQSVVKQLMRRARLVVAVVGETPGINRELAMAYQTMAPERFILMTPQRGRYAASLKSLTYYGPHWTSCTVELKLPFRQTRLLKPYVAMFLVALEPTFRGLGVPWTAPGVGPLNHIAMVLLIAVVMVILGLFGRLAYVLLAT